MNIKDNHQEMLTTEHTERLTSIMAFITRPAPFTIAIEGC